MKGALRGALACIVAFGRAVAVTPWICESQKQSAFLSLSSLPRARPRLGHWAGLPARRPKVRKGSIVLKKSLKRIHE